MLRSELMYYWKPFNQQKLREFYRAYIQPGDLCFDIGAHIGNRSYVWESMGAQVVAVEPQPRCLKALDRRFKKKPRVAIIPCGVGAQPETRTMHLSQLAPTVSTFAGPSWRNTMKAQTSFEFDWEEEIEVEIITLDMLIERFGMPVFCKIDVEGYELRVLQGLTHPIPMLSLEYFAPTQALTLKCIDRLSAIGNYVFNWSYGESHKWNESRWLTPAEMKARLREQGPEGRSGDLYATLVTFRR